MIAKYYKHTLNFKFDAGTSRGILKQKVSFFLKITDTSNPETYGIGEISTLQGLSIDFDILAEKKLIEIVNQINKQEIRLDNYQNFLPELINYPSVCFGLETAFLQIKNKQVNCIFRNDFFTNSQKIKINGLVWMGNKDFMKKQISEKLKAGYDTIKLKIGAINFEDEFKLIKNIRKEYSESDISIRLDANGSFNFSDAKLILNRLADLKIHSIEQPINVNQEEQMAELCEKSPVPIALDEELIRNSLRKKQLLNTILPQYIILKPSLMGGILGCENWINEAEALGIKWWITSALESNIGLNAICQFTAETKNNMPQGLGTGQLFENNFTSPLTIENGHIFYDFNKKWNLDFFNLPN